MPATSPAVSETRESFAVLTVPLALAGGSWIFLAVIVVIFFGVVWGYYTRSGSDITLTPSDGLGHGDGAQAPGAAGPDSIVGKVDGEQDQFETHGTK